MANYSKTQELFNREPNRVPSLKYEKSGEQISEEKWFAQDEIYRIKKADGSEWLVSRQTWIGLDRLGND
jgi:uncharacterized protein YkuJ